MIGKISKKNSYQENNDSSVQFIFISLNLVCLIFFILLNSVSKVSKKKQKTLVESFKSSFNKKNYFEDSYYLESKNVIDLKERNFIENFKAFYGNNYDLVIDNNFISFEIMENEESIDKLISFFSQSNKLSILSYRVIFPYHEDVAREIAQIHRKISRIGLEKKSELGLNNDYKNIYVEIEF